MCIKLISKRSKESIFAFLFISQIIARNPDAIGKNGMVVASHKLASQIGVDILKHGGNAIDAAIATGFKY